MSAKSPSSLIPELPAVAPPGIQAGTVLFPTEDDTPVDNIYSEKQQRLITEPLFSSWPGPDGKRRFVVMANVGLFYSNVKPPIVPDGLLSVGVQAPADMWQREHRSYFLSQYRKPPEVVLEFVSNKEGEELGQKPGIYAEINVPYYVVWDPEELLGEKRLHVFRLNGAHYEPTNNLWFAEVSLGLTTWRGVFEGIEAEWLRWCDQQGEVIPTGLEAKNSERQRAEREKLRAELEKQRAEHEMQRAKHQEQRADHLERQAEHETKRAELEKQRADRLAAQLRALGIEPKEQD